MTIAPVVVMDSASHWKITGLNRPTAYWGHRQEFLLSDAARTLVTMTVTSLRMP